MCESLFAPHEDFLPCLTVGSLCVAYSAFISKLNYISQTILSQQHTLYFILYTLKMWGHSLD